MLREVENRPGYLGIEMEAVDPIPVIKIVGGVMFATCSNFKPVSISITLESFDISDCVFSDYNRVFAGCLLRPAPSRFEGLEARSR